MCVWRDIAADAPKFPIAIVSAVKRLWGNGCLEIINESKLR
jgi:hypothetical protein